MSVNDPQKELSGSRQQVVVHARSPASFSKEIYCAIGLDRKIAFWLDSDLNYDMGGSLAPTTQGRCSKILRKMA